MPFPKNLAEAERRIADAELASNGTMGESAPAPSATPSLSAPSIASSEPFLDSTFGGIVPAVQERVVEPLERAIAPMGAVVKDVVEQIDESLATGTDQVMDPWERVVLKNLFGNDPERQKLYAMSKGYQIVDRDDGSFLLKKDGRIGGVEAEISSDDFSTLGGWAKITKEVTQDFPDVLSDMVQAGTISAAEAGNLAATGPFALATAPLVGAATGGALEELIQRFAEKTTGVPVSKEKVQEAMVFSAFGGLGEGVAQTWQQAAKAGGMAAWLHNSKSLKDKFLGWMGEQGNLPLQAFGLSGKALSKGASNTVEEVGRMGFFGDISFKEGGFAEVYDKLKKTIGGFDVRVAKKLPDPLGTRIGDNLKILTTQGPNINIGLGSGSQAPRVVQVGKNIQFAARQQSLAGDVERAILDKINDAPISAMDKAAQYQEIRSTVLSWKRGVNLSGGVGMSDLHDLYRYLGQRAGHVVRAEGRLVQESVSQQGYERAQMAVGDLLQSKLEGIATAQGNPVASRLAQTIIDDRKTWGTLQDFEKIATGAYNSWRMGKAKTGLRLRGYVTPAGRPGVSLAEDPSDLVFSSTSTNKLKRMLAVKGLEKTGWAIPEEALWAENPIKYGVLRGTAGIAKALDAPFASVDALFNHPDIMGREIARAARAGLIIKSVKESLGEEEARVMIDKVINSPDAAAIMDPKTIPIVKQAMNQAEELYSEIKSQIERFIIEKDRHGAAQLLASLQDLLPHMLSEGGRMGVVENQGKRQILDPKMQLRIMQETTEDSSLNRSQRYFVKTNAGKGILVDPPEMGKTRKVTLPKSPSQEEVK